MTFYVVRHVATGKLMPQMKRGRGYSHWNPGNPNSKSVFAETDVPRLIPTEARAERVVKLWAEYPNAFTKRMESHLGDDFEDLVTKPDGRKPEDIEIVEMELREE